MNKKIHIVSVAKKQRKNFEGKTPTEAHSIIRNHEGYRALLEMWSPEEIVIYVFLLTTPISDLSIAYDVISSTMYGYQIIQIIENDPDVDCSHCEGAGYHSCERCDGHGQESCDYCEDGDVECDECYGEGKDDEGDDCSECDGNGYVKCDECDGEGYNDCPMCEDGDIDCSECYKGSVTKDGEQRYEGKQIITYNPEILNLIDDDYTKVSEELYEYDSSKYYNLILKDIENVTDEFVNDFEVNDTLIVQVIQHDALVLFQNGKFNIFCHDFNTF